MKMKLGHKHIEIDIQTKSEGNSAANMFVEDPDTEVYYGRLHACVTMHDLGLKITMNPDPGDWRNAKWARDYAMQALAKSFNPEKFAIDLLMIVRAAKELGRKEGIKTAQLEIQRALGLSEDNYIYY